MTRTPVPANSPAGIQVSALSAVLETRWAGCRPQFISASEPVGLDTAQAVAESMYDEFREPLYAPPALLRRLVAAGRLGRKSGHGLYDHTA
jgi:3-hydroxyacyl-CoA dehydrogenase